MRKFRDIGTLTGYLVIIRVLLIFLGMIRVSQLLFKSLFLVEDRN